MQQVIGGSTLAGGVAWSRTAAASCRAALLLSLLYGCRLGYGVQNDAAASSGGSASGAGAFASGGSGALASAGSAAADGGIGGAGVSGSAGAGNVSSGGGASAGAGGGTLPPLPGSPTAVMALSPRVGDTQTEFLADASGSADVEDPTGALSFEWDWESDGSYDDVGPAASHTFASAGDYTVSLRVSDSDGNSSFASQLVSVVLAGDLIVVTTGADEIVEPGEGLSLREAITAANGAAGKQVITFDPGLVTTLAYALPPFTDAADVFGGGAAIDGSGLNGQTACLVVEDAVRLFELEIHGCAGEPIRIQAGTGSQVAGCHLHDNGRELATVGFGNDLIGPNNLVERSASHGILINSANNTVLDNVIYDSAADGIMVAGGGDGSTLARNLVVSARYALDITADSVNIWHNTLIGARSSGLNFTQIAGTDLRNNIIVGAAEFGMLASAGRFVVQSHNLFFNNPSGPCSACTLGSGSVEADPLFVDPANGDYRLLSASPAINAGSDTAYDVNGAQTGNFNGSAPDLGYDESD